MKPVEDIIKARESIRKKYLALKRGQSETSTAFETAFKPITTPLNKLVQNHEEENSKPKDAWGEIASSYLTLYITTPQDVDRRYGFKPASDNGWTLGSKPVAIQNNDIIIDGERFTGTRGLFE